MRICSTNKHFCQGFKNGDKKFVKTSRQIYKFLIQFKVQLFWESHKNVHNSSYGFEIYLVNVKSMTAQIFVAFSEKLNFNS